MTEERGCAPRDDGKGYAPRDDGGGGYAPRGDGGKGVPTCTVMQPPFCRHCEPKAKQSRGRPLLPAVRRPLGCFVAAPLAKTGERGGGPRKDGERRNGRTQIGRANV